MADFGYDVERPHATSTRSSATLARLRPPARRGASTRAPRCCSTGCRTTRARSIRGSSSRGRRATRRNATGTSGATAATAGRRTTGSRRSAARLDVRRGDRPVVPPPVPRRSSPTSTGRTRRWSRRCTTCSASGSTAASTASAPTSSIWSARTRRFPTSRRSSRSSTSWRPTSTRARTSSCAASAGSSTSYAGDRVIVGEVPLRPPGSARALLRRRRRAAHGLRLRADARPVVGRGVRASAWPRPRRRSRRPTSGRAGCSRTTTSRATARASAAPRRGRARRRVLLLTLRGTPCLYAGRGARPARRGRPAGGARRSRRPRRLAGADPVGRTAGRRRPGCPGRPSPSDATRPMLALYRRLLRLRAGSPALASGSWTRVGLARRDARLRRARPATRCGGWRSTSRDAAVGAAAPGDGWRVELTTVAARRPTWDGTLEPDEAVILAPA